MNPVQISVVYMGDSITEGQYVPTRDRWANLLSERLTKEYLSTPVNLMLVNRGISGETTRQGLERFPADVQALRPDVMTLQFGLNDANCWITDGGLPRVSEDAYRANLIEMIARARAFGAAYIILSTNHRTLRHKVLLSSRSLEQQRHRYNDIVREVAFKTEVTFCDIDRAFDQIDDDELPEMLLPYPDQLHLSPRGHQFYLDNIYTSVADAIVAVVNAKTMA